MHKYKVTYLDMVGNIDGPPVLIAREVLIKTKDKDLASLSAWIFKDGLDFKIAIIPPSCIVRIEIVLV